MNEDIFSYKRKSYVEIDEVFFWTATINQWQKLLLEDRYKEVIVSSLEYLFLPESSFISVSTHVSIDGLVS